MTAVRDLADRFQDRWLAANPFAATSYGIPGYDDRVPDNSEAGDDQRRAELESMLEEGRSLEAGGLSGEDAITISCLIEQGEQELSGLDAAPLEYTITPMPFSGPAAMLAIAARTIIADPKAASDYLERLRRSGGWIDQLTERLRAGASKGRLPVAPIVELAIKWTGTILSPDVPEPLAAPQPPTGWEGATEWVATRDEVAREVVKPALARWAAAARDVLERSRPGERPGLGFLPGGAAAYSRAIRSHTTLPLTAEQLHQTGLDEIERLESRLVELGGEAGLQGLGAVQEALRASAKDVDTSEAIREARAAIRRAEAAAPGFFPDPLPGPCEVTPMPSVVGRSGMAPHYTPPRQDGTRPGTFWFNTDIATAGTGWDLESVAFHEAVPGHHLQLSRIQLLSELPALQRQRGLTVFSEGWALYAEQLAEEMGLYSDARSVLGMITASLMRAARLVLDTGLHAFGWGRGRALEFYEAHVPLPTAFLASEIDRYIVMPGQALAYMTGKLEILKLREETSSRLGGAFSLPGFHSAVLDSGSLPMQVLRNKLEGWVPRPG
ncbi:MAG: DUF885 domain-containing protein [Acidimicrobiales bacterium]